MGSISNLFFFISCQCVLFHVVLCNGSLIQSYFCFFFLVKGNPQFFFCATLSVTLIIVVIDVPITVTYTVVVEYTMLVYMIVSERERCLRAMKKSEAGLIA